MSPELEAVVMRCLQKAPNQRFASVDELKRALQTAVLVGSGASGTTNAQQEPLNQNTYQQLQETSEQTNNIINLIKPKVAEKSDFNPTIPTIKPQEPEKQKKVRRLLLKTTVFAAAIVSMSLAYYYLQGQTDQSEKAALETIQLLKEGRNYEECVNKAKAVPQTSPFYADAQNLLNECQSLIRDEQWLTQAKELAEKNNFKDAISEASKIQPNSSFFQSARQLINQWSIIETTQKRIVPNNPPPQPIRSQVPYQPKPQAPYQPKQLVPYQPKPQAPYQSKQLVPYQPKPQPYQPRQLVPYQPKPQPYQPRQSGGWRHKTL